MRTSAQAEETAFFEEQVCPAYGKEATRPDPEARAFQLRQVHGVSDDLGPKFPECKYEGDPEKTDGYDHDSRQILREKGSVKPRGRSDLKPKPHERALAVTAQSLPKDPCLWKI